MTTPASKRYQRLAWICMGLLTLATPVGPFAIRLFLRGGRSPDWPPDRAVEWGAVFGVVGLVITLMCLSIAAALASQRAGSRVPLPDDR